MTDKTEPAPSGQVSDNGPKMHGFLMGAEDAIALSKILADLYSAVVLLQTNLQNAAAANEVRAQLTEVSSGLRKYLMTIEKRGTA